MKDKANGSKAYRESDVVFLNISQVSLLYFDDALAVSARDVDIKGIAYRLILFDIEMLILPFVYKL